jgi:hypothetical protein
MEASPAVAALAAHDAEAAVSIDALRKKAYETAETKDLLTEVSQLE